MPIGSELNETLPAVGDAPAVAAARIIDTFQRLILAVEDDVPSSAVDVDNNVDMASHGLDNLGYAQLVNVSAVASTPGTLYRLGNDLWWIHPDGSFKITDGVQLNAAGIGGIGGDYGAGAESVDYDATNDWYNFLDAPGNFSDVRVQRVRLWDSASGNFAVLAFAGASNPTFTLPVAPAGQSMVQVSAAGAISFSNTIAQQLSFTLEPLHGEIEVPVPLVLMEDQAVGPSPAVSTPFGIQVISTTTFYVDIPNVPVGHRIKSLKANLFKTGVLTADLQLRVRSVTGSVLTDAASGTAVTTTAMGGATGVNLDKTGLTVIVEARKGYAARVTLPELGDALVSLNVVYDKV